MNTKFNFAYLFLALTYLLSPLSPAHAQLQFDWAFVQGGPDSDLTSSCVLDHAGFIYTTTVLRDTTDLDPGPGVDLAFVGENEMLVLSKFSETGAYQWSSRFTTNGHAGGSIAEIKNNRIFLILYFTDTLNYEHTTPWSLVSPGPQVAAITMTLQGEIISYFPVANTLDMYFSDLSTQPDGSILGGGSFQGSVTFFSPDSTKTIQSYGAEDAFIAKFNDRMELEWMTQIGGQGDEYISSITVDANGHIYYTAIYDSTLTLNTTQGPIICPAEDEDNGIFGWLQPDGSIEKAFLFGGPRGDQLRGIVADEEGYMYIIGYFEGTVNFQRPDLSPEIFTSLNESDGFIAKYSPDGVLQWNRVIRNGDYGGIYTLTMQRGESLYISGNYTNLSDLDPGPDSLFIEGDPQGDSFAAKLNLDGDVDWLYTFPGQGFQGIRNVIPSTAGKVYIHGYIFVNLDCDPSGDTYTVNSSGGSDMFLIGLTEENVITSVQPDTEITIEAYPHPFEDHITISSPYSITWLELYTLDGRHIPVEVLVQDQRAELRTSALTAGIYIARITTLRGTYTLTLVKK